MNDEEIMYIDENENNNNNELKNEASDEFVNNLPEWDLEPPYQVIERRNS